MADPELLLDDFDMRNVHDTIQGREPAKRVGWFKSLWIYIKLYFLVSIRSSPMKLFIFMIVFMSIQSYYPLGASDSFVPEEKQPGISQPLFPTLSFMKSYIYPEYDPTDFAGNFSELSKLNYVISKQEYEEMLNNQSFSGALINISGKGESEKEISVYFANASASSKMLYTYLINDEYLIHSENKSVYLKYTHFAHPKIILPGNHKYISAIYGSYASGSISIVMHSTFVEWTTSDIINLLLISGMPESAIYIGNLALAMLLMFFFNIPCTIANAMLDELSNQSDIVVFYLILLLFCLHRTVYGGATDAFFNSSTRQKVVALISILFDLAAAVSVYNIANHTLSKGATLALSFLFPDFALGSFLALTESAQTHGSPLSISTLSYCDLVSFNELIAMMFRCSILLFTLYPFRTLR